MDHDVYTLSERERALVFTALDLYREAAEKQIDTARKKVRIHPTEIEQALHVLDGDDLRFGLLHKFRPREIREAAERRREEEQRKEREKRAQLGIFGEGGGQTVEEALEGHEEEAAERIAAAADDTDGDGEPGVGDTRTAPDEARIYDAVLATRCTQCDTQAGEVCTTVGGNPRNGFHAQRIRQAIRAKRIGRDDYDLAYALETNPDPAALDSAGHAAARIENEGATPVTLAKDRAIQAEAEGDQELEADGPDHMREALAGDERHLSEYFDLLSPTLISILKARGIITVGHVAERWDELPTITGVGQTSIEHLEAVLEEAAGVGVGGAEGGEPLPF